MPARAARGVGESGARRFRQRDFGVTGSGHKAQQAGAGDEPGEPPAVTAVLVTAVDTADDWLQRRAGAQPAAAACRDPVGLREPSVTAARVALAIASRSGSCWD